MATRQTPGLYQFTNEVTGTFYVGSSVHVHKRRAQHIYALKKGKHTNQRLQYEWNKYGADAFNWRVLAVVDRSVLHQVEQRLLDQVFRLPGCLNLCPTPSGGMAGRKHSPESRARMAAVKCGKRHSAETLERMRAANPFKGAPIPHIVGTPWNKGIAKPGLGRKRSPEEVAKGVATLRSRPDSLARVRRAQFKRGHVCGSHEIKGEQSQNPA